MQVKHEDEDAKQFSTNIVDSLKFFRILLTNPKNIGAVAPSSRKLARQMAQQINLKLKGTVIELGPGTGVVTREILNFGVEPERLTMVEYNLKFCEVLRQKFEDVNVINGDAFSLKSTLADSKCNSIAAIVSSLPLLNFNMVARQQLLNEVLELLQPNAPFIQFSYGPFPPIKPDSVEINMTKSNWIMKNLPPARVWTYCKPDR